MPARSDPEFGSLNNWHQAASPRRISRISVCFCVSVPWTAIVGETSEMPIPSGGPTQPALVSAEFTGARRSLEYPSPPTSTGNIGAE
ncbi:unannotated protein [freshwater metagenome]|uniref:Unannotated protein n=1 Tax=freshwater metagenome TaxID=449393 RepID=A0A6J6S1H6_9ZZZZ